jgi:hypothetical protein
MQICSATNIKRDKGLLKTCGVALIIIKEVKLCQKYKKKRLSHHFLPSHFENKFY